MNVSNYIVSKQKSMREWIRTLVQQNGVIIIVILNTGLVALAQKSTTVSWTSVVHAIANTLFYFVWIDYKFKLAFKAFLACGVSHIMSVSLIALYMKFFNGMGKRYELPVYIDGYFNQGIVFIVFTISIIWIFSGNNEGISNELEQDNQIKDKDFYG